MAGDSVTSGSVREFDANWCGRKEAQYNHWTRGRPRNQIQLAFRRHWLLFQSIMHGRGYRSCLEVGCGRGSISSYFADSGMDCTLLDSSESVLETARGIFARNGHKARFVHGNALALPFEDDSFDVVVSIGLLEHFEDVRGPIHEQHRTLRPGGLFLGYIVPERPDNVQRYFHWVNSSLAAIARLLQGKVAETTHKADIYRSDYGSEQYLSVFNALPIRDLLVSGVYPLPMISHSPAFPFTLLPAPTELILTRLFEAALWLRGRFGPIDPWLCDEKFGQAFLVAWTKER